MIRFRQLVPRFNHGSAAVQTIAVIGKARHRIVSTMVVLLILAGSGLATYLGWVQDGPRLATWILPGSSRLARATAAYEQGNWELAANLSRQLLKTRKDDPDILRLYARASARLAHDKTAGAIYGRIATARLETEDSFLIGLCLVRAGAPVNALKVWSEATQTAPDHPEMLDHLASLSLQMLWLDDAAVAARRLARQPRWEARGLLLLGEIQGLLANPKGARDAVRQGLDRDPSAKGLPFGPDHYRKLLARSALELGQPREAIEALKPASGTPGVDSTDLESHWLLSRAYLQRGQTADALAALKRSRSYRDDHPIVAEPGPYVGESQCASCHARETRSHPLSRHARTFHHGRELLDLPLPDRPLADPDVPGITHTFKRDQDRIRVETRAGDRVFETVVEYAFGGRDRYVTMLGRDAERKYRTIRLSSYHSAAGISWVKSSDDVPASDPIENARGDPIDVRDGVVRCLQCHVTNPRDFRDPPPETGVGPTAADAAIGCEKCHGPGANHLAAIKVGFPDRAIVNAGTASSSAIVAQCAECHMVGMASQVKNAPDDPRHVRSSGLTFTFSRCYTESGGGISCLTCHDPHRDGEAPAAFYETKCLTCHSRRNAAQTVCRVNPTNDCLRCHMPKVPVEVLHRSLRDHYIRVKR